MPKPKTGMIRARVDLELKERAETILEKIGLNASDAIRLFYKQVTLQKGLPFEVKIPNAATRRAMRELDEGKGTAYEDFDEFRKAMLGS
jgi:DNA-damage-inducible protein J